MTPLPASNTEPRNATTRARLALAGALAALATTWLVVLPWLATTKPVAAHIAELERAGIDAGAMFYTELEIAPAIAHKAERRRAASDFGLVPKSAAP